MTSPSQDLELFVRDALLRGQSRAAIDAALVQAGWSPQQTRSVLDAYADVEFPVPVPRPRASLSAREAFAYLVMFATLYFGAWNLGSLLFDLINRTWPDPALNQYVFRSTDGSIRWAMAALIIAFPVFVFVARRVARDVALHPIKRLSAIRRWLTYITLFLAAAVLIGDTTTLVYNALGGELTLRFVLKVLVVATIAGGVFGYYLRDLRREEGQGAGGRATGTWFLVAAGVAVVASLLAAIAVIGPPTRQRAQRFDERRVQGLQQVASEIERYAASERRLPADLDTLQRWSPGDGRRWNDPQSGRRFDYRALDARRYELCAVFATPIADGDDAPPFDDWRHPAGRHCFVRSVPAQDAAAADAAA
ncbi:MAG TPA: DUF5671 domain-containing protein, partial [Lysobacter sp.]|nr:DUF5671 domain-containing protein [Lysobacter sp.]